MRSLLVALFLPFATFPTWAAPTLKMGNPAPPLAVETWAQGTPVSTFAKGQIYVVEFRGTWCGPCVKAIPHTTRTLVKEGF